MAPPTSVIKLWRENYIFTFSTFSLKPPINGASYYARRFPKLRQSYFVKIKAKLQLQAFWQNFENGKYKNLVSVYETFKKSSSPKLLNRILSYCIQIVLTISVNCRLCRQVSLKTLTGRRLRYKISSWVS